MAEATEEKKTESVQEASKPASTAPKTTSKSKKAKRNVSHGVIYILAGYNNTIVTISDPAGNVIASSSSGANGFKGTRKSTAYAAQVTAENAIEKALNYGLRSADIRVKGVGAGREQSIRGIQAKGIDIVSIIDTTPVPHNGCRKRKVRRV